MGNLDDHGLPEPRSALPPPVSLVVGLGASAGGIQALTEFFHNAPVEAPIAYVVILHLSPDHESRLAEVLQRSTAMPVTQVREPLALEPGHVYVISPNASLRVSDRRLLMSPARPDERKAPVDIFLRTLAEAYGDRTAAVILSGTGADGSSGLKRIKACGGLTIAQTPAEAQHAEMPSTAIGTGLVDCILPVAEMPRRIVDYQKRTTGPPPRPRPGSSAEEQTAALGEIMALLRSRTSHDFSDYKPATVRRRIERRMALHALEVLPDYARFICDHPDEAVALMRELLISVTNFFRDPAAFEFLERRVIPRLFDGKSAIDQVRVWSAGCATGEEAYSVAMLLAEHATSLFGGPTIQVLATDLDEAAIAAARDGIYTDADVADISPERLERFFHRDAGGYRVSRELRSMMLFAHHNVIKDPPFSRLDLILCRNLLIYLNRAIQERLMETFHFALRADGYLFLGTSESTGEDHPLFVPVDEGAHVYQCRSPRARLAPPPGDVHRLSAPASARPEVKTPGRIAPGDLHLRLLEQFAPPSLIVSEDYSLIHASEQAGAFLHVTGGEPSRDVLKLVRPELRADLRTALSMAAKRRMPVEVRGARFAPADGERLMTVVVKPVLREGSGRGYFVVLFESDEVKPSDPAVRLATHRAGDHEELQDELLRIRTQLRSTIEEADTQVEDAKAANEELQAINEELATVNQELKIKLEELALSNNDFRSLINSTEIGAIFLDRALRVKLATPRAQTVFNLQPSDTGRRLSDITHRLAYPALHADVERVQRDLQTIEHEVPSEDGRWYLVRVMPYRTSEDRIEGVALTFHDITVRREAEDDVRGSEQRLRLLIDSAIDYAIFTMDRGGVINSWNSGGERVFGFKGDEIIGQNFAILFTPQDRAAGVPQQELARALATGRAEDERWHLRKGGERFYSSGVTTRLGVGELPGFAKIARDLTERRQHELALGEARNQLEERVRLRTAELQAEVEQHQAARDQVTTLIRKIVTAQEDERTRIARDLHDQLGQQLTALRLTLEQHRAACAVERPDDVDRALGLAREIDEEIDFLAWELRPAVLDDLGLVAALPRYVEQWSAHYGIKAQVQTDGDLTALRPEVEVAFYRVAQEALNNVLKHAHATRVDVLLEAREGSIVLVVEDDGVGFDTGDPGVHTRGIGLLGVRERAALIGGTMQVESSPGKGTTVFFRCPVGIGEAPT